jgi:hypothetical protein
MEHNIIIISIIIYARFGEYGRMSVPIGYVIPYGGEQRSAAVESRRRLKTAALTLPTL